MPFPLLLAATLFSVTRSSNAAAPAGIIELDLTEQLPQQLHGPSQTDHLGRPCASMAAEPSTCGNHAHHVQYYATCEVLLDDAH